MIWIRLSTIAQVVSIPSFTHINPVSFTDVVYAGFKDTVFVSTYSGRLSRIINGVKGERQIANINDEIYGLAWHPNRKEIAASTLSHGIYVLDAQTGKTLRRIPLSSWAVEINYSDDYRYLFTRDQNGTQFIWDVLHNYRAVKISADTVKGKIVKIDRYHLATTVSSKAITFWNMETGHIEKRFPINIETYQDFDDSGNILSTDGNLCSKIRLTDSMTLFTLQHPNWPLPNLENELQVDTIPLQMALTAAKFAGRKIFTGGIDRTVREWDAKTGALLKTLTGNKGSISKIKIAPNQQQVVSVDLKGGIKFWIVE